MAFPLQEIKDWSLEECADQFKQKFADIFQCGLKDISDTLHLLDLAVVNVIRSAVIEMTQEKFPQLKDLRVPQRTVVHTSAKDIVTLGHCIVNSALTRDGEKIFVKEKNTGQTGGADATPAILEAHAAAQLAELLETVGELK